jgi:hypothetical protein
MQEMFLDRDGWVLSGPVDSWGASVVPLFDLVVFVFVPTDIRVQRLREREARHFGAEAIGPDGWRHREAEEFFEWAAHYEDGTREGRTLARHEAWLTTLTCPILRLDGTRPLPELVRKIGGAFAQQGAGDMRP